MLNIRRLVPLILVLVNAALFLRIALCYPYLSNGPGPERPFLLLALRSPWHVVALAAAMAAPLPLCLAAVLRRGAGPAPPGPVDAAVTHLLVLAAVHAAVFAGLQLAGSASAPSFLAAEMIVLLAGLPALRRAARAASPPSAREAAAAGLGGYVAVWAVLSLFALISGHFGQDYNFDLINYHYYQGYAFLNGRIGRDVVLNVEGHFNPLLDAAHYLLVESVPPVWVGLILGAAHGGAAVLLFAIAHEVLGRLEGYRTMRAPLALCCTIAGLCEPMFLMQLGTTFHDNLLLWPVLAALLAIVRLLGEVTPPDPPRERRTLLAAGLLVGLASGLKLTTATFGVGAAAAALLIGGTPGRRASRAAALCAGLAPGFLLTNGFWMVFQYRHFGNPVFPFFNALFRSPYWMAENLSNLNETLAPSRPVDYLLFPFYLTRLGCVAAELPSRDLRLAVAYVLLLLAGVAGAARRARAWLPGRGKSGGRRGDERASATPAAVPFLIAFVVASYLVWRQQFCILRYFVAVDVLIPLVCLLLLRSWLGEPRRVLVVGMAVFFAIESWVVLPNYGRCAWSRTTYFRLRIPDIRPAGNGIVLMTWEFDAGGMFPFAPVVTGFPRALRFINLDCPEVRNTWQGRPLRMQARVRQLLARHTGPLYLLARASGARHAQATLEEYGLARASAAPQPVWAAMFGRDLLLWRVSRPGPGGRAAGVPETPPGANRIGRP